MQVVADNELGGLLGALNGEYITPGPGGDPIRNPDVLPTGKNMHALDPQSIPTKAAVDCAMVVVDRLLERLSADQGGEYPETVAFTLWGTDNIKTYGEFCFFVCRSEKREADRCKSVAWDGMRRCLLDCVRGVLTGTEACAT